MQWGANSGAEDAVTPLHSLGVGIPFQACFSVEKWPPMIHHLPWFPLVIKDGCAIVHIYIYGCLS